MKDKDVVNLFNKITIWKNGTKRAPHKPLLLLLAISKLVNDNAESISYEEIEKPLIDLLQEFGPSTNKPRAYYPFWRLRNDGVWQILDIQALKDPNKEDQSPLELKEKNIKAGFTPEIVKVLLSQNMRRDIINNILFNHFPESIHSDILSAVSLDQDHQSKSKRDPKFRTEVLNAYGYKCAICNFDLRLENSTIGLEAAHIKWASANGPNSIDNGICLCTLHHKLFDRGVLAFDDNYRVLISSRIHGNYSIQQFLLDFKGKELNSPKLNQERLNIEFIQWNIREVFKKPALI